MLNIVKPSLHGNGNSVNGRGLNRRHLTLDQRIDLAADLACGQQHLRPSIRHVAKWRSGCSVRLRCGMSSLASLRE